MMYLLIFCLISPAESSEDTEHDEAVQDLQRRIKDVDGDLQKYTKQKLDLEVSVMCTIKSINQLVHPGYLKSDLMV